MKSQIYIEIKMKKSTIKYIRYDCTHIFPSQYNYAMCLFLFPIDYYFPIRIIKRIANENITT